jgi:hypothetical protein
VVGNVLTGGFWRSSENAVSRRTAVVADEGDSIWMYLTEPDGATIVADCWLFNRIPAPTDLELEARAPAYRARSEPPPATADVTTPDAFHAGPLADLRIVWSADGDSVAAWVDHQLVGFIAGAGPRGYSVHLTAECDWGRPASIVSYEELFGS